jgi:hypothetical protein
MIGHMDAQEILNGAQQIMKVGAAVGAVVPFTAIVKRMLGPAADEIAERVRDEIRLYRYGRQLSLLHKAEQMAAEAGFTPKAVPVKSLFALLEGASLEENEDLHSKWAALLAHASYPEGQTLVRPSFMDTLKLMTPETAKFLDAVYEKAMEGAPAASADTVSRRLALVSVGTDYTLFALYERLGFTGSPIGAAVTSESSEAELQQAETDQVHFSVLMEELTRFQMWSVFSSSTSGRRYYLSAYAVEFLLATHPPQAKAQRTMESTSAGTTEKVQDLFEHLAATHRPKDAK